MDGMRAQRHYQPTAAQTASDSSCDSITVEGPFHTDDVTITSCSVSPEEIEAPGTIDLTMTIENGNSKAAIVSAYWTVAGSETGRSDVTIPANGSQQIDAQMTIEGLAEPHQTSTDLTVESHIENIAQA